MLKMDWHLDVKGIKEYGVSTGKWCQENRFFLSYNQYNRQSVKEAYICFNILMQHKTVPAIQFQIMFQFKVNDIRV